MSYSSVTPILDRRELLRKVSLSALGVFVVAGHQAQASPDAFRNPFELNYTGKIASACVRARINTRKVKINQNVASVYRSVHKTNIEVTHVQLEYWNGYVLNSGTNGYKEQSPERAASETVLRVAVVTGAGLETGQSVHLVTWHGMKQIPDFLSAGGKVSADGLEITVPPGAIVRCDPIGDLTLSAGERYYVQTEDYRREGELRPGTLRSRPDLGDSSIFQRERTNKYRMADWRGQWQGPNIMFTPSFIWGQTATPTGIIVVDGDSIISENLDEGDADGAMGFAKRALNALGLSFCDLSVPGTNMGYVLRYGAYETRKSWLGVADFIITNHGNNDLGNSRFETEGDKPGFKTLVEQHTTFLRENAKAEVPIMRTTLNPRTSSTDDWATVEAQKARGRADEWPLGARYQWRDLVMGSGGRAGQLNGRVHGDIFFDLYVAFGGDQGRWPASAERVPRWYTNDGTHPNQRAHIAAAQEFEGALRAYLEGRDHPLISIAGKD